MPTKTISKVSLKPFTRWSGGKQRLIKTLLPLLPREFNNYYEPFVGAGSMLFKIYQGRNCFISDVNEELIITYQMIKSYPDDILLVLDLFQTHHRVDNTNNYYRYIQRMDAIPYEKWSNLKSLKTLKIAPGINSNSQNTLNTYPDILRAARFLYLMKTCFNGIYRVNQAGFHTTPPGDVKNPKIYNPDLIRVCSQALQKAIIKNQTVFNLLDANPCPQKGDFVYFDPPYIPVGKYYKQYTSHPFLEKETSDLLSLCEALTKNGVFFMLSNSHCEFTLNIFRNYKIQEIETPRSVSCDGSTRRKVKEIVVTNY